MANFLTTSGCSFFIENVVRDAESKLLIISPYVKVNDWIYDLLKNSKSDLCKTFVYGKKKNQEGVERLKELDNCSIYYKENLHAKCYMNEFKGLITSMNIYDYSQINNIEYGIAITKNEDNDLFHSIVSENELLIRSSVELYVSKNKSSLVTSMIENNGITMGSMTNYLNGKKLKRNILRDEFNSSYLALCRYAMSIHKFDNKDLYHDNTAILRRTIISEDLKDRIIEFINSNVE